MTAPVVATIGTTHPLGIAGLLLAQRALLAAGVRPVAVVAGVSAQDGTRVLARAAVDGATIAAQFAALGEAGVAAAHVGALLTAESVAAVAAGLAAFAGIPIVVDPVVAATGGDTLADADAAAALAALLVPRATLLTPNLDEARALLGAPIADVAAMHAAARALRARGAGSVLLKGGHAADDGDDVVDVLADARGTRELRAPRIPGALRGTGDLLAATIAAELARGTALDDAIAAARTCVARAIAGGVAFAGTRVAPLALR